MLVNKTLQHGALPSLLMRVGAAFTTTTSLRGLDEIIPKLPKDGETPPSIGRAWEAQDLRKKSWDDLHKLWYVLLKQKNLLHSEKLAYRSSGKTMPDPLRITKVRKSMNRIKQVMSERLNEHEDPQIRIQLKAFIDAM